MSLGIDGLQRDYGQEIVELDGSGNGTRAVQFNEPFASPPHVSVIGNRAGIAAGASYDVVPGSITTTGCTIQVSGSPIVSADVEVIWQAHEYPGG